MKINYYEIAQQIMLFKNYYIITIKVHPDCMVLCSALV